MHIIYKKIEETFKRYLRRDDNKTKSIVDNREMSGARKVSKTKRNLSNLINLKIYKDYRKNQEKSENKKNDREM